MIEQPHVRGPVVDRPPPRDPTGSEPVVFPLRHPSSVPARAAGVRLDAHEVPHRDDLIVEPRDVIEIVLPGARWEELGPGNAVFAMTTSERRQAVWTVPLAVQRTPLSEIAAGRHDDDWARLGAEVSRSARTVVVRLIPPDDARGADVAAAFRRAASAIRRAPGVVVEWSPPRDADVDEARAAWPGSDVVDIVGIDAADTGSWAADVAAPGGLADGVSWARSQGRRLAVHWTLDETCDPVRVERMAGWLDVAAAGASLAYETVSADPDVPSETLRTYRELW